jgi:tetratricopeptide (TPR) repeat protein
VLRLHPGNEHALAYLARLYAEQGKLDEAIALFEPLPDGPSVTRARQVLGKLHLRKGSWDRALEVFARLVEGEPHNAWGHYYMGQAYRGKGLRDPAIRSFEHAVRTEPSLAEAWGELGAARLAEGSPAKAAEAYRTALALVPENPVFHAGLASTLQAQGRPREALAVHRKAVELDPRDPGPGKSSRSVCCASGRSMPPCSRASRSFPARRDSPALRVALAAGWTRRGRPEAASRTLSEVVEREPRSPDAWYYLAVAQAQRGELDAALSSLERSFTLAGKTYEALAREEPAFERLVPDPRFQRLLSGSD